MSEIRKKYKYTEEFEKDTVKLSYTNPKPIKEVSTSLGI